MLRAAGALLLVCASAGCGFQAAQRLRRRVTVLWEMEAALERMERELSYADTDMPELLGRLADGQRGVVGTFFGLCARALSRQDGRGMEQIWRESLEQSGMALTGEETALLLKLGGVLGRYDSAGQCRVLARVRTELAGLRSKAQEDRDRLSRVYQAVGTAAGAALAILLF